MLVATSLTVPDRFYLLWDVEFCCNVAVGKTCRRMVFLRDFTAGSCCGMLSFAVMLLLVKLAGKKDGVPEGFYSWKLLWDVEFCCNVAVGKTCRRMVFLRDFTAGRTRDMRHSAASSLRSFAGNPDNEVDCCIASNKPGYKRQTKCYKVHFLARNATQPEYLRCLVFPDVTCPYYTFMKERNNELCRVSTCVTRSTWL
ncbi:hypothetical protein Pcinc_030140 [Petrolisthes cinctipes]|uniref:Uncharacterized protein n=1 Tax=Petrolisthes cinctipes TaxID=88211 RepID=A0AAE1EZG0_PETCI|nr:hypothetical protein Pcinc_030140 [Petrolisthes cinctipes]